MRQGSLVDLRLEDLKLLVEGRRLLLQRLDLRLHRGNFVAFRTGREKRHRGDYECDFPVRFIIPPPT